MRRRPLDIANLRRALSCAVVAVVVLANPASADTAFLRALLEKKTATFADACRVVTILHSRKRESATFEQDVAHLGQAGILPARWEVRADKPVDRGELSSMLCKALGIKGGLSMRVLGPTRRYAFRECVFLKLLPAGSQHQYLTGADLIAVVGLTEEYLRVR